TQQNAALVEQSAAAAESLREQAARLSQVVQQFHLDDAAVAHRATAAPGSGAYGDAAVLPAGGRTALLSA
ncbi:methyl-accepting chemotaxis protein, partial [Acidovorax cattleyae]|nr:methyl-accepting chemotaxis protein [Paracidovorax cattleyae]